MILKPWDVVATFPDLTPHTRDRHSQYRCAEQDAQTYRPLLSAQTIHIRVVFPHPHP